MMSSSTTDPADATTTGPATAENEVTPAQQAQQEQQQPSDTQQEEEEGGGGVGNLSLNDKNDNDTSNISALHDNIERKGKNAYYYAHSHKATGPKWDGKAEPKLLSSSASSSHEGHHLPTIKGYEYHKSNITKYAFLDDGPKLKLYIDMEGVGDACTDGDITLDYTDTSLCLVVNNYKKPGSPDSSDDKPPEEQCLSFGRLTGEITNATYRLKKDKIILTLTKSNEGEEWHTINDKGSTIGSGSAPAAAAADDSSSSSGGLV